MLKKIVILTLLIISSSAFAPLVLVQQANANSVVTGSTAIDRANLDSTVIEWVELKHRPADEIQSLVTPLLVAPDVVIADGYSLIIKTTPQRHSEIRALISRLDKALNNLLITVVQGRNISAQAFNASMNTSVNTPVNASVQSTGNVGLSQGEYSSDSNQQTIKVSSRQIKSKHSDDNTQILRTVEGRAAYIRVGNVHLIERIQVFGLGYPAVSSNTDYVQATTGFSVTPRLKADDVLLTVAPWSDQFQSRESIKTHSIATTIQTRLGVWVEIGGNVETSRENRDGLSSVIRHTGYDEMHMLIKVEKSI